MSINLNHIGENLGNTLSQIVVGGAIVAISAWLFTRIVPLHAGLFGATAILVSQFTNPIFAGAFGNGNDLKGNVGRLLNLVVCIGVGSLVVSTFGFAISFHGGCVVAGSVLLAYLLYLIAKQVFDGSARRT